MKYHITNSKSKIIASFTFEHDRDLCFDLLDEDNNLIKEETQFT